MFHNNLVFKRCHWVTDDKIYQDYHDHEWGVPIYDDQQLFSLLNLEGQQAGLSWLTILKKRAAYYQLFADFDPIKLSKFSVQYIQQLLSNPAIIRNKLKINAIITNAKAYLAFQANADLSFSNFLWQFVDGQVQDHSPIPGQPSIVSSPESEQMSKALKKLGFKFVGPTICYAFMQASGMVTAHDPSCFKYQASS